MRARISRASRAATAVLLLALFGGAGSLSATESGPARASPLPAPSGEMLRVCAGPDNLPFSNERQEGFDNELVDVVARDLGRPVAYVWRRREQGRRGALASGACDLMVGARAGLAGVLRTRPYYRSMYVFAYRTRSRFHLRSFDDPMLRRARIGIQAVGDDAWAAAPAQMLARHGLSEYVISYPARRIHAANPNSRIIAAVARGDIDVAIVPGPVAGYFARRQIVPLTIVPVVSQGEVAPGELVIDVSMGVRPGDMALRDQLDDALERHAADIDRILSGYAVPSAADRRAP